MPVSDAREHPGEVVGRARMASPRVQINDYEHRHRHRHPEGPKARQRPRVPRCQPARRRPRQPARRGHRAVVAAAPAEPELTPEQKLARIRASEAEAQARYLQTPGHQAKAAKAKAASLGRAADRAEAKAETAKDAAAQAAAVAK